jgi:hypothetical protein
VPSILDKTFFEHDADALFLSESQIRIAIRSHKRSKLPLGSRTKNWLTQGRAKHGLDNYKRVLHRSDPENKIYDAAE